MRRSAAPSLSFVLLISTLLSGCGTLSVQQVSSSTSTGNPAPPANPDPAASPGPPVHGNVHGGQQPVVGAHIYLFAANPAGYGSPSISLFDPTINGVFTDTTGTYVLTDASGNFQTPDGSYSCSQGQQIYLLARGGNPGQPGEVNNQSLALMSIVGACPAGQTNFDADGRYVYLNEVSTIASVYALSGFMTDATHLGFSGSAASLKGIANAFLAINNLIDTTSGTAALQSVQGNGDIPQAEINTLANMLVPCINSTGATPECSTLFSSTPGPGGILPTEVVTAALNIAHSPGTNVSALFALSNGTFQPILTAAPNDWTIALTFYADSMVGPYFPAIDSAGNIWVPSFVNSTLTEFDPTGNILSGGGFSGGGLSEPYSVAIDASDNAWVVNFAPIGASTISKFLSNGTPATTTPYSCSSACFFMAFDASQNLWASSNSHTTVLQSSGAPLDQFATTSYDSGIAIDSTGKAWTIGQARSLYSLSLPAVISTTPESVTAASATDLTTIAIDSADNIWFASAADNAIGEASTNGTLISPVGGFTGGGLNSPAQIAIDGSNRLWVANRFGNSLSGFTSTGMAISPKTGYQAAGLSGPRGLAIDASGNIWLTNFTYNSMTEFIGLATPAITPISSTTHGQRP